MNLSIIYEDKDLIICHKPSGVPAQTSRLSTPDMVSLLKNYLAEKSSSGPEPYLGIIHRLDQPVEGLLLFAKNPYAAKVLSQEISDGTMEKSYLAVTETPPVPPEGSLTDYLVKDSRTNMSVIAAPDTPGAKRATLSYRTLNAGADGALVEILLETGRHHQIRVQLSHAGFPLKGDTKYHPVEGKPTAHVPIALCAYKLKLIHPANEKPMTFTVKPENPIFQNFPL